MQRKIVVAAAVLVGLSVVVLADPAAIVRADSVGYALGRAAGVILIFLAVTAAALAVLGLLAFLVSVLFPGDD